jgi:autotransporter translocation and assembly factor TamB
MKENKKKSAWVTFYILVFVSFIVINTIRSQHIDEEKVRVLTEQKKQEEEAKKIRISDLENKLSILINDKDLRKLAEIDPSNVKFKIEIAKQKAEVERLKAEAKRAKISELENKLSVSLNDKDLDDLAKIDPYNVKFKIQIAKRKADLNKLMIEARKKLTQANSPSSTTSGIERKNFAMILTSRAKNISLRVRFDLDPNDDSTFVIDRATTLRPEDVKNWENYLLSVDTNKRQLKNKGFNKVRIYTSKSKSISDYVLKIL